MRSPRVRLTSLRSLVALLASLTVAACGNSADVTDDGVGQSDAGDTSQGSDEGNDGQDEQEVPSGSVVGAGSVVINGNIWNFEADTCFSQGSFLQVSGAGRRVGGAPFYATISVNSEEDYNEDGIPDPTGEVTVEFGTDSARDGAADGEASYVATVLLVGDDLSVEEFEWELDGDYVTGAGQITDQNGVETDYGEYVTMEFAGGCA